MYSFITPAETRAKALAAHANAGRFAECALVESDDSLQAYLRHVAVSWRRIAENYEFMLDVEGAGGPAQLASGKDARDVT